MESFLIEQNKLKQIFQDSVDFFYELQNKIVNTLESIEYSTSLNLKENIIQNKFIRDSWDYKESSKVLTGGGGISCIIENGAFLEKGGVNVSDVRGEFSQDFSKTMPGTSNKFRAAGISLVLHPRNPYVPTVHANFRVIKKIQDNYEIEQMWFGGGADLTPYFLFEEDAIHFHSIWKKVCDQFKPIIQYEELKKQCDEYFYLPHRKEHRGIGGIFFDYLSSHIELIHEFVKMAGNHFLDAYIPIVEKRIHMSYSNVEKAYQQYRRGRYVEFNLIYDRGTLFGLKTGGRIESIFMSLPLNVQWKYNYDPLKDPTIPDYIKHSIKSLYDVIRKPREWV